MISVFIPNHFIPERQYVVNTLLYHCLGIEIEIIARPGQQDYELSWGDKRIVIRDQFFGKTIVGKTYLYASRIPATITDASQTGLNNIAILYGEDEVTISSDQIVCSVDLFAGAFFMLTRWEEAIGRHEDLHARFPAEAALVVKTGYILRPIVDEYVALLKNWLLQLGYPVPDLKEQYRIVPTCDVDIPYYWLKKPRWKTILAEWLKIKNLGTLKETLQNIKGVEQGWLKDPYDQFDYMMATAEKHNLSFQFNMLVGGISKFEGYYSIKDKLIRQLLNTFKERKHTIGLHPSYNSFVDEKLIAEEKKILSSSSPERVEKSRQHYLRFAVPATWRFLEQAGIKEDSTMGYAAEPGFRCGTCKPFPVFDIQEKRTLFLTERPLLIMDVSFRFYKKYTPEQSVALCNQIIEEVKKHHGELVFLWHNSNLSEVDGWDQWKPVFEHLFKID